MFISVPNMRVQRSFAGRAPIIEIAETDAEEKNVTFLKAAPVEWRPSEYSKQLYNHMFKKWSVKG